MPYLAQRRWGVTARYERAMPHRNLSPHRWVFRPLDRALQPLKGHNMKLAAFLRSDGVWPVLILVFTALLASTALAVIAVAILCAR